MTTRTDTTVGSQTSTNLPAGSPVGGAVGGPAPAATTGAATSPAVTTPDLGAVAAAKAFREGFKALVDAFEQHLRPTPVDYKRTGLVSARQVAVITPLVEVLRQYPSLAPGDPDGIEAGEAEAAAMVMIGTDLQKLLTRVLDSVRMVRSSDWLQARAIYIAACHQARSDTGLAAQIAPVRNALSRAKRIDAAASTSATAAHTAAKAQNRASNAQQRAANASQSQARASQAHAVRHPTATQVANPQGPSASANVNPHGPSQAGSQ